MKKILMFTHHLTGGGAEKAMCIMASWFARHPEKGIDASVMVVYDDEEKRRELENLGVRVFVTKTRSETGDPVVKKGINVLKKIGELKKKKKELGVDTCLSFLPGSDIINVLSDIGERRVVSVRSKESEFVHSVWKKLYVKTAYKRSDFITAVSEAVNKDIVDFFGEDPSRVMTIPNIIYPPAPEDSECADDAFLRFIEGKRVVICVGRLSPEKGHRTLLGAFSRVLKNRPDTCLVLVGDGPVKKDTEEYAKTLGIKDNVYFAGYSTKPSQYLLKSEIFVLPSDVEGMPNALLEAIACGLPSVSTDCGVREIIFPSMKEDKVVGVVEGTYGLLVPVGDVEAHSEGIEKLLSDASLCDRYRSLGNECLAPYSEEAVMEKWIEVL